MSDNLKTVKRVPSAFDKQQIMTSRLQKLKQNLKNLEMYKSKERSMSIDSADALEELVQCGICLERLKEPRMLPCQHTFCLSCLRSHLNAEAGRGMKKKHSSPTSAEISTVIANNVIEIKCPTCQNSCNIENGSASLEALPKNLYIDSLLNVLEQGAKDGNPVTPTRLLTELRCSRCQTRCQFDEKTCQHCVQVFCRICWTQHMSELKKNLETLMNQLSQIQTRLEHKYEEFIDKCSNMETKIKAATEAKIQEVRLAEKQALDKCEEYKKSEKNSIIILKNKIEGVKRNIENLDYDGIENDSQKIVTFVGFHRNTSTLIEEVEHWGEFNFTTDSFLPIGPFECGSPKVETPVIKTQIFNEHDPLENQYKMRTFTPKLIWNKCPRPAGVAIPPWAPHLLFIATTDSKTVLIMDRFKSKVVGKLSHESMSCPLGIACNANRGEVYITDNWNHCIHVFSSTGDYIRALYSNVKSISERKLRVPEGIAVGPNNTLVVCDTGNDRVVILNPDDGQEIIQLGKIEKKTSLQSPAGVAVFGGKIMIADRGNHRIKIFSMDGQQLNEFGSSGSGRGQFQFPEAIACDSNGIIFVGDAGNGRIQIFTPEGSLIRTYSGSTQNSVKFSWISGIAVSCDMDIITADSKGRKIQIF